MASTTRPNRYRTSLLSNNRIVELDISDFPDVPQFPEDTLAEWNLHYDGVRCDTSTSNRIPGKKSMKPESNYQSPNAFCRLRQASAYVLVFDAAQPDLTFQYIRQMRDQILTHGQDMYKKPIVIVANKHDLVFRPRSISQQTTRRSAKPNGLTASLNEWSCLVRKQWRCCYVECSAKFNWQVQYALISL